MTAPPPFPIDALLADAAWLHRLARALLRDADAAHDVAQDTLVAALTHARATDTPVAEPRAFLHAVLRRLAARRARTEARRRAREQVVARARTDAADAAGADGGDAAAERLRQHRALCDAVLALPEPYRTAVSLRFFDDLTPRAIGARLGVPAPVVRQRVHRGLALLRERLDAAPGGRTAWTRAWLAVGLGSPRSAATILLPTLIMKKTLLAAVVALLAGAWWWRTTDPTARAGAPSAVRQASGDAGVAGPPSAPLADDVPTPLPRATVDRLVVRAVDAAGASVAGAAVHRWRADGTLDSATTSASGEAVFSPLREPGGVLVLAAGCAPRLEPLAELSGAHALQLSPEPAFVAQLWVDGEPAAAGLRLVLALAPGPELGDVPPAVRRLWPTAGERACTTTDGGVFAFSGLPEGWTGWLTLPRHLWPAATLDLEVDDDQRIAVSETVAPGRIDAERLPTLRGRVEWADGSGPVAGAFVLANAVTFTDGSTGTALGERTDTEGVFTLGLAPSERGTRARWRDPRQRSAVTRLELGAHHGASASLSLDGAGAPLDLRQPVQLRLPVVPARPFRAIDERGQPLAGARALHGDGTLGAPTGADGRGLYRNQFQPFFGAPGREIVAGPNWMAIAAPPVAAATPLDVVLPLAAALRVRLRTPGGEPCTARAELRLTPAIGDYSAWHLRKSFGETPTVSRGWSFDEGGEVRVGSLPPATELQLSVHGTSGAPVATVTTTTPGRGDERVFDVVVELPATAIHGRVTDERGRPVPLANVFFEVPNAGPFGGATSGVDGAFRLAPELLPAAAELVVQRRGYVRWQRPIASIAELGPTTVVLTPARRVTVRIVDGTDQIVRAAHLAVDLPTAPARQRAADGAFELLDLPPGEITFVCRIGGQRFELRHDTANPVANLRVPTPAQVRVSAAAGSRPGVGGRLIALAHRLDDRAAARAESPHAFELDRAGAPPELLVPGRYRIELADLRGHAVTREREFVPFGSGIEIVLRAGEERRVVID